MNVRTSSNILISQAHAAVWFADSARIGIMSASRCFRFRFRWRGMNFTRFHVPFLNGLPFVDWGQEGVDAGPLPGQVDRAPELFAGFVVVKVLSAGGPVVVVVVHALERRLALQRTRILFDRNFPATVVHVELMTVDV